MIYRRPFPCTNNVDDSTLFEICEMNSISLMQESVDIAAEWTKNNDMKINSEKSKEMIISYTHGNLGNEVPNILIEGKVEMIQKRAVRAIFPGMSYVDILNHINLSTLKERRDYLCKKYFINMQARSHKVNCLLPKKRLVDYNLRHGNMYPLTVTRTNRFKNSLIPWGLYHWQ